MADGAAPATDAVGSVAEAEETRLLTEGAPSQLGCDITADNAGPSHLGDAAGSTGQAHPGDGVTAKLLSSRWQSMGKCDVLGFYGHSAGWGETACFSNFYYHWDDPFRFQVPAELCKVDLNAKERTTSCAFSEKAIMLCKAAVMGDKKTYIKIRRCWDPAKAKSLGRQVENFNPEEWDRVVCKVAYEAVYQKFRACGELRRILLETGDRIIAEATRNDSIWGIGIDVGDERVKTPSLWLGTNVLGWALMEVRATLAKDQNFQSEARPVAAPLSEAPRPANSKKRWVVKAQSGDEVTAKVLASRWQSMEKSNVLGFYGHGAGWGKYACFSNFYYQYDDPGPFTFLLPEEFCNAKLSVKERTTSCAFSEKAIMLCKAAVMGDKKTYMKIKRCTDPAEAKALGRQVENFRDEEWDRVVCKVAVEAVHQKFAASPRLRGILLGTGEQLIAEATRNDCIWGIGIDVDDERVQTPKQWLGTNVLGWALMEVRAALAKEGNFHSEAGPVVGESEDAAPSSPAGPRPAKSKQRWVKKG